MTIQRCTLQKLSSSDGQTIISFIMSARSRSCITSRSTSWRRSQEYDGLFALDDGTSCPNVFSPYFRKSSTKFQIRQKYKDVTKYAFHYFWCNLSVTLTRSDVHRTRRVILNPGLLKIAQRRDAPEVVTITDQVLAKLLHGQKISDLTSTDCLTYFQRHSYLNLSGPCFIFHRPRERWINLLIMSRTRCTRTPFPTPANFWWAQKMNSCIVLSVGERWRNAGSTANCYWIFWLRLTLFRITILVKHWHLELKEKEHNTRTHVQSATRYKILLQIQRFCSIEISL